MVGHTIHNCAYGTLHLHLQAAHVTKRANACQMAQCQHLRMNLMKILLHMIVEKLLSLLTFSTDIPRCHRGRLTASCRSGPELWLIPARTLTLLYQPKEDEAIEETSWKWKSFEVWFRDPHKVLLGQLSNWDFAKEMDFAAKEVRDSQTKIRRFRDFMSGEWLRGQSVRITILSKIILIERSWFFQDIVRQIMGLHHFRQWQDNCFGCNWSKRILSPVHVKWPYS